MARSQKDTDDKFSEAETNSRFEAALRGSRITGHKPMKDVSPKRNLGSVVTKPTKAKKRK